MASCALRTCGAEFKPRPQGVRQRFCTPRCRRVNGAREAKRRYWTDPVYRASERAGAAEREHRRYHSDPEYRSRALARGALARKKRYHSDQGYRERDKARKKRQDRERYGADPEYREKAKAKSRRRYAMRHAATLEEVVAAHGADCTVCGDPVDPGDCHIEHVVPLSLHEAHGIEDGMWNLGIAHVGCNLGKGGSLTGCAVDRMRSGERWSPPEAAGLLAG